MSLWVTNLLGALLFFIFFTSSGEGASSVLVGQYSNEGGTIKMPYGVDVLNQPFSHPIFSYWVG